MVTLLLTTLVCFHCFVTVTSSTGGKECSDFDDVTCTGSAPWSHDDTESWSIAYPDCAGTSQSPIDIKLADVEQSPYLEPLVLTNYDQAQESMHVANHGHSVEFALGQLNNPPQVENAGPYKYNLLQLHFHWPSEHTIDGLHSPLEMHMVHAAALANSMQSPNGLAVVSYLFEVTPLEDWSSPVSYRNFNVTADDNTALDPIIDALQYVKYADTSMEITPFPVADIMGPTESDRFYRYSGSLTTPGCYESVVWTVFQHKIKISQRQLDAFGRITKSKLEEVNNGLTPVPMTNNYRPTQPLNGRVVTTN